MENGVYLHDQSRNYRRYHINNHIRKFTQIITIQNIAKHNRPMKSLIRHDDIELTVVLIT